MKRTLSAVAVVAMALGPIASTAAAKAGPAASRKHGASAAKPSAKYVYNPGRSPVAIDVGGRPITVGMIEQKFLQIPANERPLANEDGKKDLIQSMIDKAYMGWLLEEAGYTLNPEEQKKFDDYKTTTLRNFLYAEKMDKAARIPDAELRAIWKRQNHEYWCHQLAVATRARAESLSAAIRGGADFGAAATALSIDPQTKISGGDVGMGMVPGFMNEQVDEALAKMKPGQVSPPIAGGPNYFWVVRLDSLVERKLQPFEQAKNGLLTQLVRARQGKVRQSSIQDYIQKAEIVWVDSVVKIVAARYDSVLQGGDGLDEATGARKLDMSGKYPKFTPAERSLVLLRSKYGTMTVAELMDPIAKLSSMFRPKLRTPEALEIYAGSIAAGPAIDDDLKRWGIDTLNYAIRDLRDQREYLLAQRYFNTEIEGKCKVPEDTIRAFYEARKDSFYLPEQAKVQVILVSDSTLADSLYRQVKLGDDFARLAGEFSEEGATRINGGVTEFFKRGTHDDLYSTAYDSLAFLLGIAEVPARPIKMAGFWVIMKGVARQDRQMLDYEHAKKFAQDYLQSIASDKRLRAELERMKKLHPLKVYPKEIARAKLGHVPENWEL